MMIKPRKLLQLDPLVQSLAQQRARGRRVAFTNGCFDILHAGHVRYLREARNSADLLVVGLNSDVSVKAIKGHLRPILTQHERAEVLSALTCVNYITLFDTPDPYHVIAALQPDVLVKGADWSEDDIIGADLVRESGGRVLRVPVVSGVSTTAIIGRIMERYGGEETR